MLNLLSSSTCQFAYSSKFSSPTSLHLLLHRSPAVARLADLKAEWDIENCLPLPGGFKGFIKTSARFARAARVIRTYSEFLGLSCNSIWVHHCNKYRDITKRAAHSSSNADSQGVSRPLPWKRLKYFFGQCGILNWCLVSLAQYSLFHSGLRSVRKIKLQESCITSYDTGPWHYLGKWASCQEIKEIKTH